MFPITDPILVVHGYPCLQQPLNCLNMTTVNSYLQRNNTGLYKKNKERQDINCLLSGVVAFFMHVEEIVFYIRLMVKMQDDIPYWPSVCQLLQ